MIDINVILAKDFSCLLFRVTNTSIFNGSKDCGRSISIITETFFSSKHSSNQQFSCFNSNGSQFQSVLQNVSNSIDVRNICFFSLIDRNLASLGININSCLIQSNVIRAGISSNRKQDCVTVNCKNFSSI